MLVDRDRQNVRLPPPPRGWPLFDALVDRISSFLGHHGRKLWWFHSLYALTLGALVVLFAQKGFERARMLAVSIGAAWLLVLVFFRLYGSGQSHEQLEKAQAKVRLRFFAMTYVLKNLYQGMLFFVLPFYFKSATWGAPNFIFVILLGLFAILATMDIVMDRVVMRRRAFASIFHGLTIFATLNLVIPALFPNTRTLYSLVSAGFVTVVAFWTLHAPIAAMKKPKYIAMLLLSCGAGVAAAYFGRVFVPPVPMHLSKGAVGPKQLEDGRLAMEVKELDVSVIREIFAVTDVVVPGGEGDSLLHVWRLDGREIHRSHDVKIQGGPAGSIRLRSSLGADQLPDHLTGSWTVDVETEDGQLVARVPFTVTK
jgi:hypothetical protein